MRESEIEKAVCNFVLDKGGIAYKFTSPQRRNVPDRLIVLPMGIVFFIEFKATGKKPNDGQVREMGRLKAMGHIVHVVDDIEQGKMVVSREIVQGYRKYQFLHGTKDA